MPARRPSEPNTHVMTTKPQTNRFVHFLGWNGYPQFPARRPTRPMDSLQAKLPKHNLKTWPFARGPTMNKNTNTKSLVLRLVSHRYPHLPARCPNEPNTNVTTKMSKMISYVHLLDLHGYPQLPARRPSEPNIHVTTTKPKTNRFVHLFTRLARVPAVARETPDEPNK